MDIKPFVKAVLEENTEKFEEMSKELTERDIEQIKLNILALFEKFPPENLVVEGDEIICRDVVYFKRDLMTL